MLAFRRFNFLKKKFFSSKIIWYQVDRDLTSSNESRKKRIENAPKIRDFLLSQRIQPLDQEKFVHRSNENVDSSFETRDQTAKHKVYIEVHGCQMNVNDTEVALAILKQTGIYEQTLQEKDADVILFMTCSIRENAEQKIWNKLRELRFLKLKRPQIRIGILGCMAERLKEKVLEKEKLVDVVCGPDSYRSLPALLESSCKTGNAAMNVQLSLDETYADVSPVRINKNKKTAFVSIQRGCDNMCSFCIGSLI